MVRPNTEDLLFMTGLYKARIVTPVIDRYFSLSEVPDALRYLGAGHVKGKIVIIVEPDPKS
jgi:NADPH:quinone reductase-like Zn-dependent oxidoreductase